jgi:hypothetical protein
MSLQVKSANYTMSFYNIMLNNLLPGTAAIVQVVYVEAGWVMSMW